MNGDVRVLWVPQQQLARKIDRWVYLDEHSVHPPLVEIPLHTNFSDCTRYTLNLTRFFDWLAARELASKNSGAVPGFFPASGIGVCD